MKFLIILSSLLIISLCIPTSSKLNVYADKPLPTTTRGAVEKNVLVYVFYKGHNPSFNHDYLTLIQDSKTNMENASRFRDYGGTLAEPTNINFNIVDIVVKEETLPQQGIDCEQYLPQIWTGNWTKSDWETTNCWGAGTADYYTLMDQENICALHNQGVFDEVWIYGFGYAGLHEYAVGGNDPYIYPIMPQYPKSECNSEFYIMGFNYEDMVRNVLHSFSHRVEIVMYYELGGPFYELFTGLTSDPSRYNDDPPAAPGKCGNAHIPPNADRHYGYNDLDYITTDCEDWRPDSTGATKTINCEHWGCDSYGYFMWWLRSIPGYNNQIPLTDGAIGVPNMWGYFMNLDGYNNNENFEAHFISNLPHGSIYNYVSVNFVDTTIGNPVEWFWDFGDGTYSTTQNPSKTFGIGTFNITLKVKDQYGNTSTYQYPNYVTIQSSW